MMRRRYVRTGFHKVLGIVATVTAAAGVVACGSDSSTGPSSSGSGQAYIRYINGVYQEVAADPPVITTIPLEGGLTTTLVKRSVTYAKATIDVLVDSSETAPSIMGLDANSISAGTVGQSPADLPGTGYFPVARGVRGFVARRSGLTPTPGFSFFTTAGSSGPQQYLPRQYLTGNTYYTLGIAGTNASPKTDGTQAVNAPDRIVFHLVVDDPFPPPTHMVDGKEERMARFRVANYATWGSSTQAATTMQVYLTPGNAPPTLPLGSLTDAGVPAPSYDNVSFLPRYNNVPPGTYYVQIVPGTYPPAAIYGQVVTFKAGETHTLVVLNDMPTFTVTNTVVTTYDVDGSVIQSYTTTQSPTPPTFKIVDLVDNKY
jgi:hypothetical protein